MPCDLFIHHCASRPRSTTSRGSSSSSSQKTQVPNDNDRNNQKDEKTHSFRIFACCDSNSYKLCLINAISWIWSCTTSAGTHANTQGKIGLLVFMRRGWRKGWIGMEQRTTEERKKRGRRVSRTGRTKKAYTKKKATSRKTYSVSQTHLSAP